MPLAVENSTVGQLWQPTGLGKVYGCRSDGTICRPLFGLLFLVRVGGGLGFNALGFGAGGRGLSYFR